MKLKNEQIAGLIPAIIYSAPVIFLVVVGLTQRDGYVALGFAGVLMIVPFTLIPAFVTGVIFAWSPLLSSINIPMFMLAGFAANNYALYFCGSRLSLFFKRRQQTRLP
jgi:hypothetical protein